jgi:hypothetical protein
MKKKIFYAMTDGVIQETEDAGILKGIVFMWERDRPLEDILQMSRLPFTRVKEVIKNHIGENDFGIVATGVKSKQSIAEIASSTQLSEASVARIIDLFF